MPRELDWAGLREYLHYGATLGERTMFADIRKLLPGHILTIDVHRTQLRSYASILDVVPVEDDLASAVHHVRDLLEQAVRSHLISDVPVGVFLSGGVDSTALTAFASRHNAGKLQTFSAGFDFDSGFSELPQSRTVARHFGTEHHELHIQGRNLPSIIEQVATCHDVPFADAANIPLYLLCLELQGSIKVVLQGDGGDELFGGYARYSRLARQDIWQWLGPVAELARPFLPRRGSLYRGLRTITALRHADPEVRMALLMSQEPPDQPPERIFSTEAQQRLFAEDPFARYRELYRTLRHLDPVQRMLHTDAAIILADTYLEKVDKATMAHGIEVRVPFLDNQLARYAMSLPASFKATAHERKRVLKRALRGVVPDVVLDSPKRGFGVPMSNWLRRPLADYLQAVLLDESCLKSGLFDEPVLARCIDEHLQGQRDHGFLLYKVLQFNLWYRKYLVAPENLSSVRIGQAA